MSFRSFVLNIHFSLPNEFLLVHLTWAFLDAFARCSGYLPRPAFPLISCMDRQVDMSSSLSEAIGSREA